MKKIFLVLVFAVLLIGIFAAAEEISVSPEVSAAVDNAAGTDVGPEVTGFIEDFVEKRGIDPNNIENIQSVDFDALPKEVNIENVGDHNLGVYEVDYSNEKQQPEKIYVVAYSVEKLAAQGDIIVAQDKRNFLTFGHGGEMSSGFLETATGVTTSLEKGYVMPRDGSITAVSTNLEVLEGLGNVEIIVYKNGEQVSFGNTLDAGVSGIKKDYDVQSKNTVQFNAGDIISVYAKAEGDVVWKDVITIVEITTSD